MWSGRNCVKAILAHRGSVNALFTCAHGVVSGGVDRKVKLWTLALEPGATFDMSAFGSNPSVRSVCLSADGQRMLVGTAGNEVYMVSAADGSDVQGAPITMGHYGGAATGLAVHPLKPEYATVGVDGTVRVWDLVTRVAVKITRLDTACASIAYHPNGDLLAVGLGGGTPSKKDGAFVILNEADLTVVHEAKDSKLTLTSAKFSPDGDILAMGSEDACVYLYAVSEEYESIGKCRRHTEPITNMDFDGDSKWLQTNCAGGQLLFFNATTAQYQSNLSAMKDVDWSTQSCVLSFSTVGAWRALESMRDLADKGGKTADNPAITAVDRATSDPPGLLVTGDSYGRVRLFRYPSREHETPFHEWRGHSSPIRAIKFMNEDTHVISIGQSDRCVFQWRYAEDERYEEALVKDDYDDDDFAPELRDHSDLDRPKILEATVDDEGELPLLLETAQRADGVGASAAPKPAAAAKGAKKGKGAAAAGADDSSASSKPKAPWMLAVVEPTAPPKHIDSSAPLDGLVLDWVHGYRAHDTRNNAR